MSAAVSIIMSVLPLALKLITMYLDKANADVETRKKWHSFVDSLENSVKTPARIKTSARRCRDDLDARFAELDN